MSRLYLAGFASVALLSYVRAGAFEDQYGTFVSCMASAWSNEDSVTIATNPTSAEGCSQECYYYPDQTYMWSYYLWGTGACMCSNTYEPLENTVTAAGRNFQRTCEDADYEVWVTASTWSTNACYTRQEDPEAESLLTPKGQVDDPEVCLTECTGYEYASTLVTGDSDEATMNCWCGPAEGYYGAQEHETECGVGYYTTYQHLVNTVVGSGFAKRQLHLKERLIRQRGRKRALCPGGLTACTIAGVAESFECIDTTSELESCGGCVTSAFNDPSASLGLE
uniref:WSC domain-containing protein n=1 Tax=Kwoniella dejecticola CBS 10117 TaxID=1296121 RepID=A0A1A5ZTG9_9TREE|nr:uncharacterized protein I303_08497 [Kwoniella dejecticola CBS 10117]OBR81114.1 hypothetical protein I303_08497 [Kwoniella dejecticola CBS 10117]